MIPHFTFAQTKFVRTTEGALVLFFGAVLFVIPLVTSSLPPALATSVSTGKWVLIATVIARTGLKGVLAITNHGGPAPAQLVSPAALANAEAAATDVAAAVGQGVKDLTAKPPPFAGVIAAEIAASHAEVAAFQARPGTPPDQVTQGLAPDPTPPPAAAKP